MLRADVFEMEEIALKDVCKDLIFIGLDGAGLVTAFASSRNYSCQSGTLLSSFRLKCNLPSWGTRVKPKMTRE